MRYQEIQQELSRDQARFIRHSLRHPSPSANTPGSVSATSPTVDSPVGQTPTGTNGSSRLLIPSKVEDAYKELNQLADEKIALSQRIIEVLARSRARLDFDLAKVRALQGESEIPNTRSYQPYSGASTPLPIVDSITLSAPPSLGENLRNSLLAPDVLPLSPAATAAAMGSVPKKRRITVTNSIKLPSPIPQASSVGASSASSRSRLSRQAHIPRPPDEDVLELDIDPDAEGDEDLEADDAEDTTIYCFCQKTGAGEMMIGCDNPSCSYQWVSFIRGLHFQLSVTLVPRSIFVMGLVLPSLSSHRRFRPKFPAPITPRSFQLYCGGIILPPQRKYFHIADDDIAVHRLSSFPSHRLSSCEKTLY
ncbi:hypothetical protein PTI98_005359 [Pleurotus ostreatus]|nr:hypothetical protein PTI98_005359 [Pleurotus ostreatus]